MSGQAHAQRLDAALLAGFAWPDSPPLIWLLRGTLAVASGMVVLIASVNLGAWALAVAVPITLLIGWQSDGRRLLDLTSEFTRFGSSTHTIRIRPTRVDELPAVRIEPGDHICLRRHVRSTYPRAAFTRVLAVKPGASGWLVALCSGTVLTLDRDEPVLRLPVRLPRVAPRSADALRALLDALPRDRSPVDEPAVIDIVTRAAGESTARRVLRAAIVASLVQRRRSLRGWVDDVRRAFWRGGRDDWIGRGRTLELTGAGLLWLDAGRLQPAPATAPPATQSAAAPHGGFEYDICLSFAAEQRPYVEQVAGILRHAGIRVFYDFYEQSTLWGVDLYQHLTDVYGRASRFCLLFASADYARKVWTSHERRVAQARALHNEAEYILPARFDDTEVPGLLPTVGYIDLRRTSPERLAALVQEKLSQRRPAPGRRTF
jgi:hypothetical protein